MARRQTAAEVAAAKRRQAARRKTAGTSRGVQRRRSELVEKRKILKLGIEGGVTGSALRLLRTQVRRAVRNVAAQEAEQARRRRKAGS
ncbi:hypothetical protein LCGC14_2925270 [marine sediment metagenome]|uniref:Uncharacterized protein n=1 Tax=marine sediment metagenome TaxID=412755 RepID=A0A0F9ADK9_9ZZZZ